MTTKAAFSKAEWDLLVDSPFWIQNALTSHRAGGGERVGDKYVYTLDKILADYRSSSQLVQEVVAANQGRQFEETTTSRVVEGKIEQIGDLLEEQKVDPADAAEFRKFLLAVGQKVTQETSEGLFGLGDKVSDREKDKMETITVALKATEADEQRRAAEAKKRREAETKAKADREAEARAKEKAAQEQREAAAKAKKEEAGRQRQAEARVKAKAKEEVQEAAAAVRDRLQKQKGAEVAAQREDERKLKGLEEKVAPKSPPEARKPAKQEPEKAPAATKKEPKAAPKTAPAKKSAAPEPQLYEVKSGDSLSKIAQTVYGDMERWREIYEANKDQIKDPNVIEPGQKLVIPHGKAAKAASPRVYEVKSGDSLSQIAQDVYGQASRWQEIYEANKDQIKDPNMIQPGQKLRIP